MFVEKQTVCDVRGSTRGAGRLRASYYLPIELTLDCRVFAIDSGMQDFRSLLMLLVVVVVCRLSRPVAHSLISRISARRQWCSSSPIVARCRSWFELQDFCSSQLLLGLKGFHLFSKQRWRLMGFIQFTEQVSRLTRACLSYNRILAHEHVCQDPREVGNSLKPNISRRSLLAKARVELA